MSQKKLENKTFKNLYKHMDTKEGKRDVGGLWWWWDELGDWD